MTLLWDNDAASSDRYGYAVGGNIDRLDTPVALMRTLEDSPRENLVLIGPDVDMQSACERSESVRVHRADVGVILLRRRLDVSLLGQALRAGVREVIPADDLTGLADAVRRSRELSQRWRANTTTRCRTARLSRCSPRRAAWARRRPPPTSALTSASTGAKVLVVDLDPRVR